MIAGLAVLCSAGGHGGEHKKYIINVPLHYKHHHHTHTIVKHVYHKAEKPEYKVLGYTHDEGHGHSSGGDGGDGGGSHGGSDEGAHELSHGYMMESFGGHSGGGGGGYEEQSYGGGHEEVSSGGGHGWE